MSEKDRNKPSLNPQYLQVLRAENVITDGNNNDVASLKQLLYDLTNEFANWSYDIYFPNSPSNGRQSSVEKKCKIHQPSN